MSDVKTLLQLAGADTQGAHLNEACLILIDMQNEYLDGPIAVNEAGQAVSKAADLLSAARAANAPVFHIAHRGLAGSLFDRAAQRGQIIEPLSPVDGETIIEKTLPNSFAGTSLNEQLLATGRKQIILCGFMTHMCVSSTARAALDHGFRVTIDADACATRDLPDGLGGTSSAKSVQTVSLAALADRFAIVLRDHQWQQ